MTEENIEPMDSDLASLLKRGAPQAAAPSGVEDRLFERLSSSIPGLGPGPGPGPGGGGAPTSAAAAKTGLVA